MTSRRGTIVHRSSSDDGFTMTEAMLTVVISGIIMIPLLAWMLIVFDQSDDTSQQERTADLAALSRSFIRDVEGAAVATLSWPTICDSTQPLDPENPVGTSPLVALHLETIETTDPQSGAVRAVETQYIVHERAVEDGSLRGTLWRRRCTDTATTDSLVGVNLLATSPTAPLLQRYAQISCREAESGGSGATTPDPSGSAECEVINLTMQPERAKKVSLSAMRRPDGEPTTELRPRPIIVCTPSCEGTRDAEQEFTISFDSSRSRNVEARLWDFGDGTPTSSSESPTHSFRCLQELCTFNVSLTVVGGEPRRGARATTTVVVRNFEPIVKLIEPTAGAITGFRQSPAMIKLDAFDQDGGLDYTINWNDPGSTGNQQSGTYGAGRNRTFTHVYERLIEEADAKAVTLTVTDEFGAGETFTIPLIIKNALPVAEFSASRSRVTLCPAGSSGCDDRVVSYDSTYDPTSPTSRAYDPDGAMAPGDPGRRIGPGPVQSVEWAVVQRQAGGSVTGVTLAPCPNPVPANATVPCLSSGTTTSSSVAIKFPNVVAEWEVRMRATDNDGESSVGAKRLSSNQPPRAVIDYAPSTRLVNEDGSGGLPAAFTFSGARSFDPDGSTSPSINAYKWTVTKANETIPTASFTSANPEYSPSLAPGVYTVRLVVVDEHGAESPLVDGRIFGVAARTQVRVKVNARPQVSIPNNQEFQRNVKFNLTASASDQAVGALDGVSDGDGIEQYVWRFRAPGETDWSDPEYTTSPVIERNYSTNGDYRVLLTAIDNHGAERDTGIVRFSVVPAAPIASFSVTPGLIGSDETVFSFTNTSSDPDGYGISRCRWTFDKVGTSDEDVYDEQPCVDPPTRVWSEPGSYEVTLTVWDGDSPPIQSKSTEKKIIRVLQPLNVNVYLGVNSQFVLRDYASVPNGGQVVFAPYAPNGGPTNDPNPGGGIESMSWNFGDGGTSSTNGAVTHAFSRQGSVSQFQVTLIVRSRLGLEERREFHITVNDKPVAMVFNSTKESQVLTYNVNCEPNPPSANLTVNYGVTGCNIISKMKDSQTAGDVLNGDNSYDPDGAGPPTFGSLLLRNIEATNPQTFCWRQGGTSYPCSATISRPSSIALVTGQPATPTVTGNPANNTIPMYLQVKDANGDQSDHVEFRIRLNAKPNNVRIVSSTDPTPLPSPAPAVALQTNVQTTAAQISSPAGDLDQDAELTYKWTFRPDGALPAGYVTYEATSQKYPKVTFSSQVEGWVDLTVTDQHGFAVDATSRRFTVGAALPVAKIELNGAATGSPRNPVWFVPPDGSHPRLVLTTFRNPGSEISASMSAGFTGVNSFSPDGVPITGYSWQLTKQPGAPLLSGPGSDSTPTSGATYPSKTYWGDSFSGVSATWTLQLTVTDANLRTGTATLPIRLNRQPSTVHTCLAYYSNSAPYQVTFTNSSSDQDLATTGLNKPAYMRWTWGDGGDTGWIDWAATTKRTYPNFNGNASGRWYPTIETLDIDGATGGVINCASPPSPQVAAGVRVNREPTFELAASPTVIRSDVSPPENRTVSFTSSITDQDNASLTGYTYSWRLVRGGTQNDFNSGTQQGSPKTTKDATFDISTSPPDVYWGELTVTDAAGGGPAMRKRVKVRVNAPPTARLVGEPGETNIYAFQSYRGRLISASASTDDDSIDASNPNGVITHYRFRFYDEQNNLLYDSGFITQNNRTVTLTEQVPAPNYPDQQAMGRIVLTVRDADGQEDEDQVQLSVFNGQPTARIKSIDPNAVTHPATPTFDGSESSDAGGGPIARYEWRLYRQSAPNTAIATHTSTSPTWKPAAGVFGSNYWGEYAVDLIVYDSDNLPSTYDVTVDPPAFVEPPRRLFTMRAAPTAVITSTPASTVFQGATVQRVSFSGTSSFDPDGTPADPDYLTYRWVVKSQTGDEVISWNGPNFNDVDFIGSGTNYVHLTVTDSHGNTNTAIREVVLNSTPAVTLVPTPRWANPAPSPATTIDFTFVGSASDSDGLIDRSIWTFKNANGTVRSTVNVDGEPGTQVHAFPNVAGTYEVTLRVYDSSEGFTDSTVAVRVNAAPTAAMEPGPYAMFRNTPFTLDATASTDTDSATPSSPAGIATYQWSFFAEGNPSTPFLEQTTTSSLISITPPDVLVPATPGGGVGRVRLVVVDADGLSSPPIWNDFTISNSRPVAVVTLEGGGPVGPPGMARTFRGTLSTDADGTIEAYRWSFFREGEATPFSTATGEVTTNTFSTAGRYVVKLEVEDDDGATSIETTSSVIDIKANLAPVAGIKDFASLAGTMNNPIALDGSAPTYSRDDDADDPGDQIASWGWTVYRPDGAFFDFLEGPTPSFTPDAPGNWKVTLTVIDHDGEPSLASPLYNVVVAP